MGYRVEPLAGHDLVPSIAGTMPSPNGRLVVLHEVNSTAADFYRAHDFQPSPTNSCRLIMKLSTTARALDLPWP
ncbi:MAG TPA: hypothetical protein VHT29_00715 [Solirubrobacteraceae bacterium]|nr:hypothetical protein [Solirubrobacteraceae bacterium]